MASFKILKQTFSFILFLCVLQPAFAQKQYQVTVKTDSSMAAGKVQYQLDDGGIFTILKGDSVGVNQLVFKGNYQATKAVFNVYYIDDKGEFNFGKYLLDEQPAFIELYYKPNVDLSLFHTRLEHAYDLYDTTSNVVFRRLMKYKKQQNLDTWHFYQKYEKQFSTNDSLLKVYKQMIRSDNQRSMEFLKNYAGEYFTFWYFRNEIAAPLNDRNADVAYIKELYSYYKTTFPPKFTQSYEGLRLTNAFEGALNPLKLNGAAPLFTIQTLDGKSIKLGDLKGKFVLLDFWATWCGPCMKEVPFIKSIRDKYTDDQLVIIGISRDINREKWMKAITAEQMNWNHFLDRDTAISDLYGVKVYPTLILLNPDGKIIYKSDYENADDKALPPILNKVM